MAMSKAKTLKAPQDWEPGDWLEAAGAGHVVERLPEEPFTHPADPSFDTHVRAAAERRALEQEIVESLRQLREAIGLTQADLGRAWGRPPGSGLTPGEGPCEGGPCDPGRVRPGARWRTGCRGEGRRPDLPLPGCLATSTSVPDASVSE